jgi:hypothetical protein
MCSTGRRGIFYQAKGLSGNPEACSGHYNTAKTLPAAAKKTAPAKRSKPAAKAKPAKPAIGKKAAAKPKVKPKKYNTTPVERIDSEVAFIRRYAAMNGKVICRAAQSGFCQFERIRQE